jgi:RNA polymerase sigma-70 factor (ECF subfamily)
VIRQSSAAVVDSPSDAELVQSALGGDAGSLSVLLVRYRAELYARALTYLGRSEDAADAVQETFLLTVTRLADVRDPQAVRGWLHAVLRSVCLRELRRPARRLTVATGDIDHDVSEGRDSAELLALRDWVWAALEDLPEPLRLVTLLRFFGPGHSYAQIAALCGVPVGTVRSRLHQAKSELGARLLAECGTAPRSDGGWSKRVHASYLSLSDRDPDPYLAMFASDAEIAAPGLVVRGRNQIREMCEQDLHDGVESRLVEVISSAAITVLECELINPDADPDHCPPGVTHVLLHGGADQVQRSLGYFHPRPAETSEPADK